MNMRKLIELNSKVKYKYSKSSLNRLVGVHPDMIRFAFELANVVDCKLVYGVRTAEEQNKLFKMGRSGMDGYTKKSNHQKKDDGFGYALDILPLPRGVNMYLDDGNEDNIRWGQFDGLCHGIAHMLGIRVKTGFKWRSGMMESLARPEKANSLPDGNHIELILN